MRRTVASTGRRVATAAALGVGVLALSACAVPGSAAYGPAGGMMGGPMMGATDGGTASGTTVGGMMGGPMMGAALTCAAPAGLPGSVVTVSLVDMPMMGGGDPAPLGIPMRLRSSVATVPAGQVSVVAQNLGARTHELVVVPLAAGEQAGGRTPGSDGTVAEDSSVGEASASCAAGSGDGIVAGSTGWVTLTLAPGRYELLCNEQNHYADGMWTELDVT